MGTDASLAAYLTAQSGKRFELGVHDCLTFTNGWWQVRCDAGFADEVIGKYGDLGQKEAAKLMWETFNTTDLRKALDDRLQRVKFPTRGDLVISKQARPYFTGYAMGICSGVTSVFLGGDDMIHLATDQIDGAWTCRSY